MDFFFGFRLGFDFVADHLMDRAPPDTMTSKYERICLPDEQSFNALYDENPQTAVHLHSKQCNLHMTVPKNNAGAVLERWIRGCQH